MGGNSAMVAYVIIGIFIAIFASIILFAKLKGGKKRKLRDSHMLVKVEMIDLVYQVAPPRYQLKMVYAHPKDGKKRYYMTESLPYDPVMNDDAKLDYEYDMYVHPTDPKCYYVDVSRYVKGYPSFEEWIRRI